MAKGWKTVLTNKIYSAEEDNPTRRQRVSNNMLRNVKRKSLEDFTEESRQVSKEKEERKKNLINAFEENKLKSKTLIKEAKKYKKVKNVI